MGTVARRQPRTFHSEIPAWAGAYLSQYVRCPSAISNRREFWRDRRYCGDAGPKSRGPHRPASGSARRLANGLDQRPTDARGMHARFKLAQRQARHGADSGQHRWVTKRVFDRTFQRHKDHSGPRNPVAYRRLPVNVIFDNLNMLRRLQHHNRLTRSSISPCANPCVFSLTMPHPFTLK